MSEQGSELEAFSKYIESLDPCLGEVVLVGGSAHRLYRLDGVPFNWAFHPGGRFQFEKAIQIYA